jgi:hypothetical protein
VTDNRLDIAALTEAIRRGDLAAFEKFYELYCDRLYHLLLTLTRGLGSSQGSSRGKRPDKA